jgi:hypothetical protein
MHLLLIGCTGFVGRALVPALLQRGHELTLLSRRPHPLPAVVGSRGLTLLQGDPAQASTWQDPALLAALQAADGVVNLAGEPIAEQRWTPEHLRRLRDSRVQTTEFLVAALKALPSPPEVLVNGSAVGYYGTSEEASFNEGSAAGDDVLGALCQAWESAADLAPPATRVVKVRTGIVLAADGGALGKMLPIFRAGFGGPIGSGRQWMSWIHRDDLVAIVVAALEDASYRGVYNAVAPAPATMAQFSAALGRSLGRPSLLPVPGPILQLLLGDGAQVVLKGQRVLPERLQQQGFRFTYPELSAALAAATTPESR